MRRTDSTPVTLPRYKFGARIATRNAYGDALVALGARSDIVALDAEVGNSTHAQQFVTAYPDRFFEMFIAEQQLVAAAGGLVARGFVPFASTFAAFFSLAYDVSAYGGDLGSRHPVVRVARRRGDRP